MKSNDLSRFTFKKTSFGQYRVRYTTLHGDYYEAYINDMTMIDATLHAEHAMLKDIVMLKNSVKCRGHHYSKMGLIIY